MQDLLHTPSPGLDWEKLRPVLDQVMHDLKTPDREAVLMRYFENRQFLIGIEQLNWRDDFGANSRSGDTLSSGLGGGLAMGTHRGS